MKKYSASHAMLSFACVIMKLYYMM